MNYARKSNTNRVHAVVSFGGEDKFLLCNGAMKINEDWTAMEDPGMDVCWTCRMKSKQQKESKRYSSGTIRLAEIKKAQ